MTRLLRPIALGAVLLAAGCAYGPSYGPPYGGAYGYYGSGYYAARPAYPAYYGSWNRAPAYAWRAPAPAWREPAYAWRAPAPAWRAPAPAWRAPASVPGHWHGGGGGGWHQRGQDTHGAPGN